tara:strand:- start:278 stop:457 length:180 start_codon:yes stop_codon:yes gene_type:complete
MEINKTQKEFIIKAINMKDCLFDFEETDKTFKEFYGISKKKLILEIKHLLNKIEIEDLN